MTSDIEAWPPPNDPVAFESLCLELWKEIWGDVYAQKNGRSGQPQCGVDVFGKSALGQEGVQCKQKDGLLRSKLTVAELRREVDEAHRFKPGLKRFILATTAPQDGKLQESARELSTSDCEIVVWAWDRIWAELYQRKALLNRIAHQFWPFTAAINLRDESASISVNSHGLEAVDRTELDSFFADCAKYEPDHYSDCAGGSELHQEQFLISYGFAERNTGGKTLLTDAGLLFCGKALHLPSTRLHARLKIFWGRHSGSRENEHIQGCVLALRRQLLDRLESICGSIIRDPDSRNSPMAEAAISEYPKLAIREAVVNFVIHRDYAIDQLAFVEVHQDRVVFTNPGINDDLNPDDLLNSTAPLQPRYHRNQRIIAAMGIAGYNQEYGSGIITIKKELLRNGTLLENGAPGLQISYLQGKRFRLTIFRRIWTQPTKLISRQWEPQRTRPTVLKHVAQRLIGREKELEILDAAWANPKTHVVTFVAWGGAGKTSLVAHWATQLAERDFDGADYFDWSFYSQGSKDTSNASGDAFIDAALRFFGDEETANSAKSPWDKGARLAKLVADRRTLLILDGLEPLQNPIGSPLEGELKDPAVAVLLKGLAARNAGLCIVTTRVGVSDLAVFHASTAPELTLERLTTDAGVRLLGSVGVHGNELEMKALVDDVDGHALTIDMVGRYLAGSHGGDIRRRDRVGFSNADKDTKDGRAIRAISMYVKWIASSGEAGKRSYSILRLLGLFDRPADPECIAELRKAPVIPNLTDALVEIDEEEWNRSLRDLEKAHLLRREGDVLDAHPLVREYFAKELQANALPAWKQAHSRIFDYLCRSVETQPDTPERLAPLYQAVSHGCHADRQQEALETVFLYRILRDSENYSTSQLGLVGADLAAATCFFDRPWSRVTNAITDYAQGWVLSRAASCLQSLGRLGEAVEPTREGLRRHVIQEEWNNASIAAANLGELEITLGKIQSAMDTAKRALDYADQSKYRFVQSMARSRWGHALACSGQGSLAREQFEEAERIQAKHAPENPFLHSLGGFQYCDLLLADCERAAAIGTASGAFFKVLSQVEGRSTRTLKTSTQYRWLLDIGLDHLSIARSRLYSAILRHCAPGDDVTTQIEHAVESLRKASDMPYTPLGLLTRAWVRKLQGDDTGSRADLDEADEIASRGPMPLILADVALHRARLFQNRKALAEARRLIDKHGYGRRRGELEDAENASATWPQ